MISEAGAAIAAAVIAAVVSSVLAVLTKDQKTTEFRQAWIDQVRNDVSELVSLLSTIAGLADLVAKQGKSVPDFLQSKSEDFLRAQACILRLRLRLNIKDDKNILNILERFDCGMKSISPEIFKDLDLLVSGSQFLLKKEWMRVRRGEVSFVLVKYCWLIVFVLTVGYFYRDELSVFTLRLLSNL
ncbi:hypothetical protein D3C77_457680 [compost metagenome]